MKWSRPGVGTEADDIERWRSPFKRAIDLPKEAEENLRRLGIPLNGTVEVLFDERHALGDLPAPAVFSDRDRLIERFANDGGEILDALRASSRVSGLALLEAGVLRRLAVAHLVVAIMRHWP